MSQSRFLLVCSLGLLIGVLLLTRSSPVASFENNQLTANSIISIGSSLPNARLLVEKGLVSSDKLLEGKWTMLIVCSGLVQSALYYPSILSAAYHDSNFQYVFLLRSSEDVARFSAAPSPYLVVHGADSAIFDRLRLPRHGQYVWSFLIGPDRRIRFSQPSPLKDDIQRQLVEKYAGGRVRYDVSPSKMAAYRGRMPRFKLTLGGANSERDSQELLRLSKLIVFIPAYAIQDDFTSLASRISAAIVARGTPRTTVVLSSFYADYEALFKNLSAASAAAPSITYARASIPIPEWENPYLAGADTPRPAVFELRADHVTQGEGLYSWLDHSRKSE